MSAHMKQDEPDTQCKLDEMSQGIVGTPAVRLDGLAKVTGTATYAAEYTVADCLHGVLVTAPFARGTITGIHAETALERDGIVAVIDDARLIARAAQGTAGEAPKQNPRALTS